MKRNLKSAPKSPSAKIDVLLDRLVVVGTVLDAPCIKTIAGFQVISDFRPRTSGRLVTYGRVRKFRSLSNSTQVIEQYEPQHPWLADCRFTIIADDKLGITADDILAVVGRVFNSKVTLVELAFDFPPEFEIDGEFVLRHGIFGKSRRRREEIPGLLRFGSRSSTKLVRCYFKEAIRAFRVELEIHSALIRKLGGKKIKNLPDVAWKVYPAHIQFGFLSQRRLHAYLLRKFGPEGEIIFSEARKRAALSLRRVTRYLGQRGVPNVHRFVQPLAINADIKKALQTWILRFENWGEYFLDWQ